jgi:hypothetical protein
VAEAAATELAAAQELVRHRLVYLAMELAIAELVPL